MTPVVIELATVADVSRLRELTKISGAGFDPEAELARSWALVWVARAGGVPEAAGFALAWRTADELHLLDLAVDASVRRQGLGRSLLQAVIADARHAGSRLLLLEARASNEPALALYRSAGFFVTDVRRAYYSDNGEDALVMRLELAYPPPERDA